jgi:electron transfer flavoprotein alpha subunit
MAGVLVFAETQGGAPRASALELVRAGRNLAEALGKPLAAVVIGEETAAAAEAIGRRGVPHVFTVEDALLAEPNAQAQTTALAAVVGKASPDVILFAASTLGRDLAPALAARLGVGVVSEAVSFAVEQGKLRAVRPVYAGKAEITVEAAAMPVVMSLRPKSFEPAAEIEAKPEVTPVAVDLAGVRSEVREVRKPEVRQVDLTEADVIVAGGRGMKGPEHFHLIEELAAALGGVVGASRAVVDAGWRPHSEQVGQTGKTVAPKLYVACGISGAIQHLAGMTSSRCIVAVNRDPEAPIFRVADYGIVGDVFDVLPALIAAVKEKKGG